MTMPKKGSRTITVAGNYYRYMIRLCRDNRANLRLVVESVDHPGHTFQAAFTGRILGVLRIEVQPRIVEKLIVRALQQGWAPAVMRQFILEEKDVSDLL